MKRITLIITLVSALCVTNLYAQPQLTLEQKSQIMKANASNWYVGKDAFDNITKYSQKNTGLLEKFSYSVFEKQSNGSINNFIFWWDRTTTETLYDVKAIRLLVDGKDITVNRVLSTRPRLEYNSASKQHEWKFNVGIHLSECKELADAIYKHDTSHEKGLLGDDQVILYRIIFENGTYHEGRFLKVWLDNLKSAMEFYTALGGEWTTSETAETIKEQEK